MASSPQVPSRTAGGFLRLIVWYNELPDVEGIGPAMMKPVVIWDFNGTILDDFGLCLRTINQMLARRGLKLLTASDYLDAFDFPVKEYYRHVGFNFKREPFADLAAEYMSLYQPASFLCPLRPGIPALLDSIRRQGRDQILLSATRQDFLIEQIRHFGLDGCFADILGLNDILGSSKLEMASQWFSAGGFTPAASVLIGDTTHDYEVARTLGCRCLLLDGGHNSRQRLAATGMPVLSDLAEVREMISQVWIDLEN